MSTTADGVRTVAPGAAAGTTAPPSAHRPAPLRIGVLVSATGANLSTLLAMEQREPDAFRVCLVASHASDVEALRVARDAGVETWSGDFDSRCGLASRAVGTAYAAYQMRARSWHDALDERLAEWERRNGGLDLIVLAYHRWIDGNLLTRYSGRMINQHPADLSVLDAGGRRLLVGKDPVRLAMTLGHPVTRTSCFMVDGTRDGGPILCMGPPVPVKEGVGAVEHERTQKLLSDRPCLEWTVRAFAAGRLGLGGDRHSDESRVVLVDGQATPLGGMRLA